MIFDTNGHCYYYHEVKNKIFKDKKIDLPSEFRDATLLISSLLGGISSFTRSVLRGNERLEEIVTSNYRFSFKGRQIGKRVVYFTIIGMRVFQTREINYIQLQDLLKGTYDLFLKICMEQEKKTTIYGNYGFALKRKIDMKEIDSVMDKLNTRLPGHGDYSELEVFIVNSFNQLNFDAASHLV
jgi:hypothetical protein